MKCEQKTRDYLRQVVRNGKLITQFNNEISSVLLPTSGESGSDITYLELPVTANEQILFPNVIPSEKTVLILEINGILYHKDVDFSISGTTISWLGTFSLITSDNIIMWVS